MSSSHSRLSRFAMLLVHVPLDITPQSKVETGEVEHAGRYVPGTFHFRLASN